MSMILAWQVLLLHALMSRVMLTAINEEDYALMGILSQLSETGRDRDGRASDEKLVDLIHMLKKVVINGEEKEKQTYEDLSSLSNELDEIERDFYKTLAEKKPPAGLLLAGHAGSRPSGYLPKPQDYFHSLNILQNMFGAGKRNIGKK